MLGHERELHYLPHVPIILHCLYCSMVAPPSVTIVTNRRSKTPLPPSPIYPWVRHPSLLIPSSKTLHKAHFVTFSIFLSSSIPQPLILLADAAAESLERRLSMRNFCYLNHRRVKPIVYQIDTCRFLAWSSTLLV